MQPMSVSSHLSAYTYSPSTNQPRNMPVLLVTTRICELKHKILSLVYISLILKLSWHSLCHHEQVVSLKARLQSHYGEHQAHAVAANTLTSSGFTGKDLSKKTLKRRFLDYDKISRIMILTSYRLS